MFYILLYGSEFLKNIPDKMIEFMIKLFKHMTKDKLDDYPIYDISSMFLDHSGHFILFLENLMELESFRNIDDKNPIKQFVKSTLFELYLSGYLKDTKLSKKDEDLLIDIKVYYNYYIIRMKIVLNGS